jgi:hypothetical protein
LHLHNTFSSSITFWWTVGLSPYLCSGKQYCSEHKCRKPSRSSFQLLWVNRQKGISGSYGSCISNFVKNFYTVFYRASPLHVLASCAQGSPSVCTLF